MPIIVLRLKAGVSSSEDIQVTVQDKTLEYLESGPLTEVRVSAYLDQDLAQVEASYAEMFLGDACEFIFKIKKLIPGSRVRKGIVLPGPMYSGEQLVILVEKQS